MSARKTKTRRITEADARSYLEKAAKLYAAMLDEFDMERWSVAALIGVHCAISSADAILGKTAGIRSAGDSHGEAAQLIRLHVKKDGAERQAQRLLKIIQEKNAAAYDSREFTRTESADMLKDVGRFFEWAKEFFD